MKQQSNVITQGYNEGSLAEILRHNQAEEKLRQQQYNLDLRKQGEQEIINTANVSKTKADTEKTKAETEFMDDYLRMQGLKTATGSLKDFTTAVRGIIGGLGGIQP